MSYWLYTDGLTIFKSSLIPLAIATLILPLITAKVMGAPNH